MIIRVPLIQGFNADEAAIQAITDFAADELHVGEIHFALPHPWHQQIPLTQSTLQRTG